jgi:hypothetical protein
MINSQKGASLVVALVLMTIITLVAVYSIEGSSMQSKMIANSVFSNITYQECRNEQEANIRFYNDIDTNRVLLLNLMGELEEDGNGDPIQDADGNEVPSTIKVGGASGVVPFTQQYLNYNAESDISYTWSFVREDNFMLGGSDLGSGATGRLYLFHNDCVSTFRFATNSQTLGVAVQGLVDTSILP